MCGVPLAALPLATAFAIPRDHPMIMPRKETKGHGTNNLVEGVFQKGDTSLVIEDTAVSGHIKKMFWQVLIPKHQRDLHRIITPQGIMR